MAIPAYYSLIQKGSYGCLLYTSPGHVAVFRVIYTHGKVPICQFFHSLNVPLQWVDKDLSLIHIL